jgi:PAS domain S-box-containing protein
VKKDKDISKDSAELRHKAEERLKEDETSAHAARMGEDAQRLVHELQVHQIELELQNEELRQARADVEVGLQQHVDLYDFAPVGYFTLDREGLIRQVNLTGAGLLGMERARLVGTRFGLFVSTQTRAEFNSFLQRAFETRTKETCEVGLLTQTDGPLYVRIESGECKAGDECRIALSDITERKQIEDTRMFLLETGWSALGEDFFQSLARYLAGTLGMDFICIDRLTGDRLSAETVAVYFDGVFEDNMAYALKDTPCGDVMGKTVCSFPKDVRHLFPKDEVLRNMKAEAYIGTTLWSSQGEPIGLIAMISRKPLANPKPAETILQVVSIRAAGELERRQTEEALEKTREQVTRIFESISDAFLALDGDWRFTYVNNEAERILLKSREELVGANIWDQFPETVGTPFQTECERAVREGIAVQFEARYPRLERWFEVRAYPYEGGLSVYLQDTTERRAAQDILALASERYAHIADVLQQTLIPPPLPTQPAGYEIAARYQPALAEAEVGGDFYDLIDLGNGRLGIVIGDIVGKGLRAAARVAAAVHTMRSYAFLDERPSWVMTLTNSALFRGQAADSDMLTAFYAMLDIQTGELVYTNAGHVQPLVSHPDGSVELLTEGGPMLMGTKTAVYPEGRLSLQSGDLIVLVTDGITESRVAGQPGLFGSEGIVDSLSRNMDATTEQIAAALLEDAESYANGALRDDAVILLIRKLSTAEENDHGTDARNQHTTVDPGVQARQRLTGGYRRAASGGGTSAERDECPAVGVRGDHG